MREMVCGFCFSGDEVLLVQKTHPEWQLGLLNGVGGHVDPGEASAAAMAREWREETLTTLDGWQHFATEVGPDYLVHFYRCWSDLIRRMNHHATVNDAGERLLWVRTGDLLRPGAPLVGNLRWLVPLALDWRDVVAVIRATDNIRGRPRW